ALPGRPPHLLPAARRLLPHHRTRTRGHRPRAASHVCPELLPPLCFEQLASASSSDGV
ncbi:hypothetical protein OC842_007679, partial [Tilletia horrida]